VTLCFLTLCASVGSKRVSKAVSSAEILAPVYQSIRCHLSENINPDTRRTECFMSQSFTAMHIFASFSRSLLSELLVFDKLFN